MVAKNALEQKLQRAHQDANQPSDEQDRIAYAIISEVNQDTSQVKIQLLNSDGTPGEVVESSFLPLINPLEDIHMRFGALRPGLVCRIYWRGTTKPTNSLVEVIGDENHSLLRKVAKENKVNVGPYLIFSGGI